MTTSGCVQHACLPTQLTSPSVQALQTVSVRNYVSLKHLTAEQKLARRRQQQHEWYLRNRQRLLSSKRGGGRQPTEGERQHEEMSSSPSPSSSSDQLYKRAMKDLLGKMMVAIDDD